MNAKETAILNANAEREAKIRSAQGEAASIRRIAAARAEEVKMVYGAMMKANPSKKVVQLKSLETLKDVADGDANKIFILFEDTSTLSSLGVLKDAMDGGKIEKSKKAE